MCAGEKNVASFRFTLHLLKLNPKNLIASIRIASHLLQVIEENYMGTFIRIETFSNSGQFQHRVVYMGASIIRRFKVPEGDDLSGL